MKKSNVN